MLFRFISLLNVCFKRDFAGNIKCQGGDRRGGMRGRGSLEEEEGGIFKVWHLFLCK